MDTVYRFYAALKMTTKVAGYANQCSAIVAKMGLVAKLQSPLLAQATTNIAALMIAEQLAHKGSPAQTADRNAKLEVVKADMRQLKALVQGAVDADLANAQVLIESAGMSVAKRTVRSKPPFAVKQGKVTGTAILVAKAVGRRASYEWLTSSDQKTWNALPNTVRASTSVSGLTPATLYYFRFRALTADGLSDWSAVVSFIAH
jgi:hypothetical protein